MLELQPLMDQILDQIAGVVEYEGATISLIEGDESEVVAVRGRGSPEVALGLRIPVRQLDPAWESWRAGPYIIHDVQDDSPDAVSYRQWRDAVLDSSFSYIRSWLVAPFIVNERLVGVLTLHGDRPGMYSPHHAALIFGIANQAAVAIENARLYAASEQRARELATLLDISRNVASTLQIHPLLDLILQELGSAVRYDGAGIVTLDRDEVRIVRQRGPDAYLIPPETRIPMAEARPLWSLIVQREGIIIDDVRGETDEAEIYRELVGQSAESYPYIRSWMAVPMRVKDRAIGALFLAHSEPASYTAHHAEMALAVAQQAAIAIENARLYERAQEVAVLEERQRLSRELHDSVSQALYGIALGAQTARAVVERDPSQVVQPLDYVLSLAQTAMSEMRGLIFELRPEAVEQEGLVAVLRQQAKAAGARHGVQVTMTDSDEPSLPLEVKEALYRVAQEALHNAVKHAGAAAIALSLERDDGAVVLTVQDDGKGFDPAESFPGHLGLYSMRERAEGLGGTLAIESAPGAGTRVSVRVAPAPVD
jgi:signal transduction histidine kinase